MSLMLRMIHKEKNRVDYMLASYFRQLEELPKGAIVSKTVGSNKYYYLKYRSGKKVVTDYLGKEGENVAAIRAGLEKRRHIEAMVVSLQFESKIAGKVLEGKR
jgi:hypothetical protein